MKLSVVIPAHNEEGSIAETLTTLYDKLQQEGIDHEIVVVNDNSKDRTLEILEGLKQSIHSLNYYTNNGKHGFGYAVRYGLERFNGDCVAIMMADLSDDPADLVKFYRKMVEGNFDCVFFLIRTLYSLLHFFKHLRQDIFQAELPFPARIMRLEFRHVAYIPNMITNPV